MACNYYFHFLPLLFANKANNPKDKGANDVFMLLLFEIIHAREGELRGFGCVVGWLAGWLVYISSGVS